jgi:hypothetical protein
VLFRSAEAEAIDEEDECVPEPKVEEEVQLITIGGKQVALKKRKGGV